MSSKQLIPIATIAVFIAHFAGQFLGLYKTLPHFDSLVHFLGGLWVALVIAGFGETRPRFSIVKGGAFFNFLVLVSLTLSIGVFWEFFEFILYKTAFLIHRPPLAQTWPDTLSDLFFDIVGAGFASFLLFFNRHLSNKRQVPSL